MGDGDFAVFPGEFLGFFIVDFVGGGIGFRAARSQRPDQQQEAEEAVGLPVPRVIGTGRST